MSEAERIVELTIPNYSIEYLESEISRINKRLIKKGIEARIFPIKGESKLKTIELASGKRIKIEATDYRILLPELKLPGSWELIGALDHESLNGELAIVKSLPGKRELPREFQKVKASRCDHCKRDIRRNDTFAIESEAGEILIVGRKCISDFLGIDPSGALYVYDLYAKLGKLFAEAEDRDLDRFNGIRRLEAFEAGEFLIYSAQVIRSIGYTSKAKAEAGNGIPTSDLIWDLMLRSGSEKTKAERDLGIREAEDHDLDLAQASLVWIFALPEDRIAGSEYLRNLIAILTAGIVNVKTKGYASSLISVYQREASKQAERETEAERGKASEHIGEIKQRIKGIELTIRSIRYFEGNYGATYICKLSDPENNDLVWFASFDPQDRGYKIGEAYQADLTIKAHDLYRGAKQTKVNRVSFK